jgi:Glycosyl transferase family 2
MQETGSEPTRAVAFPKWKMYINGLIASELSAITRYYDNFIQWHPRKDDTNFLLDLICCRKKRVISEHQQFPDLTSERDERSAILLNGTVNHHFDIQGLLIQIKSSLARTARVLVVVYNPYLSWLYRLANKIGIRKGEVPTTFITRVDLENIAKISGYSIVRTRHVGYFPWACFGLGTIFNRFLPSIPFLRWLSLVYIAALRPIQASAPQETTISCVIPARNERGNIEHAIERLAEFGREMELIFVEGHSTDGTWEEILRVKEKYSATHNIKAFQQKGKGKSDAVRLGFSYATGTLLTILDADLTMPPELLIRFYNAYCEGHADFINGSRLVYPMEGNAMRFLNRLGNIFFAKMLSWILDARIGDSLCGTKLVSRSDYQRMISWRKDFGDIDPFGDFELIFPAAQLALGVVDIPVRYLDRRYGSTNISRFRHGLILFKMTILAYLRIKTGTRPWRH